MKKISIFLFLFCCVISAFSQANISFFQTFMAGNNVIIAWETTSETQIASFKIEQVIGGNVNTIGEVIATGNSSRPIMYNFSDMGAMSLPAHCYQIKMMDINGNSTYIYSDSACVNIQDSPNLAAFKRGKMKITTDNANKKATISMPKSGKYSLVVYDLDGKKLGTVYFEGVDYELDVSQYKKNTFYIETIDMRNVYVEKITTF